MFASGSAKETSKIILGEVVGMEDLTVKEFKDEMFNMQAGVDEEGNIHFNVEDVAIGLGFTTVAKSGNTTIRWSRVNGYLQEFNFSHRVGKGDFIPEQYFYLLAMKATNKVAVDFQKWLAFDVIPKIRKDGMYVSDSATDEQKAYNFDMLETTFSKMGTEFFADEYRKCIQFHKENKTRLPYKRKHKSRRSDKLRTESDSRIMIMEKVLDVALERSESYRESMQWELKSLLDEVVKEIQMDVQEVKRNQIRGKSAQKTRQLNELQEEYELIKPPSLEDYHVIHYHPMTMNRLEAAKVSGDKANIVESTAYANWKHNFPSFDKMPRKSELNVDFSRPIRIHFKYDHLGRFDRSNFDKTAQDMIFRHYAEDDWIAWETGISGTNKHVDSYEDGRIYFYMENITKGDD